MKLTLGQSIKIIALSTVCLMAGVSTAAQAENVKNIVLVHGAFVGGAGWRPV
ncbi:hypothetical protein NVIRENTERO_00768 [Sodalis praecaptivus]|nr:hypothetical protein [Sodalis praecaptivus]CAJ0992860.1 hypothetical protein NVIRENTERO_00768 [Sodalis praecaptivus]